MTAAQAWCADHAIPVDHEVLSAGSPSPVSPEFTERRTGHVGVGERDVEVGYAKGIRAGTPLAVRLTARTDDVDTGSTSRTPRANRSPWSA